MELKKAEESDKKETFVAVSIEKSSVFMKKMMMSLYYWCDVMMKTLK